MKIWMVVGLVAAWFWVAVVGGWGEPTPGERLAMTFTFAKAFPGLGGVERHSEYYLDQDLRLVRIKDVTKGTFDGDPDRVVETVFRWNGQGVSWQEVQGPSPSEESIVWVPQGLVYQRRALGRPEAPPTQERRIRFSSVPEGWEWEDGRFSFSWKKGEGYQARLLPQAQGVPGWGFGYTTRGSRLTQWTEEGLENNRILLNRTPQSLQGTFVVENESLTGWESIGSLLLTGPGLWTPKVETTMALALILDLRDDLAICAPLVFEKNYLR